MVQETRSRSFAVVVDCHLLCAASPDYLPHGGMTYLALPTTQSLFGQYRHILLIVSLAIPLFICGRFATIAVYIERSIQGAKILTFFRQLIRCASCLNSGQSHFKSYTNHLLDYQEFPRAHISRRE